MMLATIRPTLRSAGALFLLSGSTLAAPVLPQDAFEPNDDCAAPPVLATGLTSALDLNPDDDYFTVSIPNNASVSIEAVGMSGSLDIELLEVGCGSMVASATAGPIEFFECGGVARDLVLRVPSTGATVDSYSIDFTATEILDDTLEENDTCVIGTPARIATFTTPDLMVTGCDEDYYAARLENAGIELQVDLLFAHADGDIDIEIWDDGCNTMLASSATTTDNESVRYTNTSNPSVPENVTIRVFLKSGAGFAPYDLTACFGDGNLPNVGTQSCAGVSNSTGRPGTLCARGSDVAADNALFLYVVDLPSGSAGYFITSPTSDFTANPAGSQGNLCLGAPGRYSFDPLFTQTMSAVFYQPDLANTPIAGGGFGPVTAGQRQFWQFWYRDSVGGQAVSNFSSTLCVDFQ